MAIATPKPAAAAEPDGVYGRMEGDLSPGIEVGVSGAVGDWGTSAALAARTSLHYLHTVGLTLHYTDALGQTSQPIARSLAGGVEVRPLFLGRFARDMEQGPAYLDLFVDSFSLGLAVYGSWGHEPHCGPTRTLPCRDVGMELSAGFEVSLLPQFNSPFVGLRAATRWSVEGAGAQAGEPPVPMGLFTLTLGYHHVLAVNLVDLGDRAAP